MRILQVITSLLTGGAETLVVNMVPRLRAMGYEVDVCVFNGVETPLMRRLRRENPGIRVWKLGNGFYNPVYILKLIRIMRHYDIVHAHNSSPQLFVAIASLFCRARLCTTEHSTSNRRRSRRWLAAVDRWMYGRYSNVICISGIAEKKLREYVGESWLMDASGERMNISTINNGVDVEAIHNASQLPGMHKQGDFVVTMVAGFREAKDQDTIVRALKLLPVNYVAWFVGVGDRMAAVKRLVSDCGLENRVSFLGLREDVARILKSSDVVCMSSHWEGLSLSNIEGMAAGKPFVASDVNGLREVTRGYGVLFPEGNAAALANELKRLHDEPRYYGNVARLCYERAQDFDIGKTVAGYSRVYGDLSGDRQSMQKKKIIRVTTHDISLDHLLEGQLRFLNQYYDVVGVAKDTGELETVRRREGVRCIDVPMAREISIGKDIHALYILYKVLRREKPWMVHANTPKGSLLAMIASCAARVPRRVYTVTGLRYQGTHGLMRWVLKTMERITCSFATNVIPEGQGVLHSLRADHITVKPLKVLHYGNINGKDTKFLSRRQTVADIEGMGYDEVNDDGIRSFRSKFRKGLGFGDSDFVFIFVGRIVADKGMAELCNAMKRLSAKESAVKLLLVGSMEDGDAVPNDVRDYFLNASCVKYVGMQTDVRPYLMAADALVFPSYREGFPNVPMEAGAMDLPCIVTDINGANEIIRDGLNGKIIMAPLDDKGRHVNDITPALVETMSWFANHPAEVARMSRNARRMIHERYEQRDVWAALLDYYRSLE